METDPDWDFYKFKFKQMQRTGMDPVDQQVQVQKIQNDQQVQVQTDATDLSTSSSSCQIRQRTGMFRLDPVQTLVYTILRFASF